MRAEVAVRLLRRLHEHPAPEHASCFRRRPIHSIDSATATASKS